MKKLTSIFLAIAMILTLAPMNIMAAGSAFSDVKDTDYYAQAATALEQLEILSGYPDGTFGPEKSITRAEMAAVVCRLIDKEDDAESAKGDTKFDDVTAEHWASGYVNVASKEGIINGDGNGKFRPEDSVKYEEAIKMVVCALGYGDDVTVNPNDWSAGYLKVAKEKGISDNLKGIKGQPSTRGDVAVMSYNGITADLEAPKASLKEGSYIGAKKVALTAADGAEIYYTTNGSIPNASSTKYEKEILIEKSCTLKAVATKDGILFSDVLSLEYGIKRPRGDEGISSKPSKKEEFTVSFDLNYDGATGAPASQKVEKGELATIPEISERSNYKFAGWFINKNESDWTNTFDFSQTPITQDTVLYAIWVDITTDTDNDGLADELEIYIGTDINNKDSDFDGLSDYDEKMIFNYNPMNSDSDFDSINDFDEDYDGDNLTNSEEYSIGTNPILVDSDNDDLTDYEEINTYKTNPMKEDTDDDKVKDGDEIKIGSNPLVAESKFLEKGSFGILSDAQPVTVDVETTISGEQVGTLNITPVTYNENHIISPMIPGYIGNAVDITIDGTIDSAKLKFNYDKSLGTLSDDFQPRIYYYNEDTYTFEELPDQKVSNGSVEVTINHFSTYILLNKVEFDKVWNNDIKPPLTNDDGSESTLDISFVIDYSASMDWNDSNHLHKAVTKEFISKLRDGKDKASIVKFIRKATIVADLTSDKDVLNNAVDSIDYDSGYGSYSGTDGSTGINAALETLSLSTSKYKYIIFMTDGEDNGFKYSYDDLIATSKNMNTVVYTIGLGSAKEDVLKKVADSTGGKYYHATTNDVDMGNILNLDDVFKDIESETVDLKADMNDDKIPDYFNDLIKKGELVLSNGSREFIGKDFNFDEEGNICDDLDGDGLKNGEEIVLFYDGNKPYLIMKSNPLLPNSDGDIYSDYQEYINNTNPMIPTYECSYVDYPWDDDNFTYIDVYNEEDKWYNEGARQIWSTITLNWSHEDESKRLLTSFFEEYSDITSIKKTTESIKKEVSNMLGEYLLADAWNDLNTYSDLNEAFYDMWNEFYYIVLNWKSAGNSAKNLNTTHFGQLKAQISLFKNKYNLKSDFGKFDFKGISKLDWIGNGVTFVVNEGTDIYEWINAYSALTATQDAFKKSEDVLEQIKANDDAKEGYVSKAASDILLLLNKKSDEFNNEKYKELALSTGENVANLGLGILSAANPYVAAINLAIGALDWLTPTTEIAEGCYYLYVIDEIVNASKNLFWHNVFKKPFYNIPDEDTRYIELIICSRIWGGEFAKNITGKQIYLGVKDEVARQEYRDAINAENSLLEYYLDGFLN